MDELDLLISKWGTMGRWQKALLLVIILGPIIFTLNQGYDFYQRLGGNHASDEATAPKEVNVHIDVSGGTISNESSMQRQSSMSNEELRDRAKNLANNITDFIGDSDIKEKQLVPHFDPNMTNYNTSNHNESLKMWIDQSNRKNVFEAQVIKDFEMKYLGELVRIRFEFQKHNITDRSLDAFFWNPNYQWMHNIPLSLHEMANKLL
jgi:hypothetical protein